MKKLGIFDDDVLIGENDGHRFYITSMTQDLTAKARKMDIRGIELRGWTVVMAQSKTDNSRMFLLVDDKNQPVRDSDSFVDMSWHIDLIKLEMDARNNIVTMAEEVNKEKKRKKKKRR